MIRELWSFFRRKLRKGNGAWWALVCTWHQLRWLRVRRNDAKYMKWLNDNK